MSLTAYLYWVRETKYQSHQDQHDQEWEFAKGGQSQTMYFSFKSYLIIIFFIFITIFSLPLQTFFL